MVDLVPYARAPRLVIAANAIPGRGGQGLNLTHMTEALRRDFELEILSANEIAPSGIMAIWGKVPYLRRLRDWQAVLTDISFDRSVARRLPSAAIFQGAVGQCATSLETARAKGCRTALDVVTLHIDDFVAAQRTECARFGIRPVTHPWLAARIRREYQNADLIRVMSDVARQTFLRRGFAPERVVTVTPPFDVEDDVPVRAEGAPFRVCYVGLLEPWKGFHYLVDAFCLLGLARSELVFWGGTGSRPVNRYFRDACSRQPSIKVRPQEVREVGHQRVYGEADVLVHPSLADGFGYVVGEAMACGLPVIVTSTTGAADLVVEGHNGYVVPPGDARAIAERLRHLAENPDLVRRMGEAARETTRRFTIEAFRERWAPRLRNLVHD